jgi:hypothetical protein
MPLYPEFVKTETVELAACLFNTVHITGTKMYCHMKKTV